MVDFLIEYRSEDRKTSGELEDNIGSTGNVFNPSSRKPRSSPPKNEPFSQEKHLKIPLLSWGLKLSNSKTDYSIDYRCDDEKKLLSWGNILVTLLSWRLQDSKNAGH
jgi:hypothetical protein